MLDWVCCKNLCIAGFQNNRLINFNKLYYNHDYHRLELNCGDGKIMASPTWTSVGGTQLVEQQEVEVLMTLVAEGYY